MPSRGIWGSLVAATHDLISDEIIRRNDRAKVTLPRKHKRGDGPVRCRPVATSHSTGKRVRRDRLGIYQIIKRLAARDP
jgi:hypothetical protein